MAIYYGMIAAIWILLAVPVWLFVRGAPRQEEIKDFSEWEK